jgi:hypothetical protein
MNVDLWWNINDRGKLKYPEKNLFQCHLGSNLGLCCGRPVTDNLSFGMAITEEEAQHNYITHHLVG